MNVTCVLPGYDKTKPYEPLDDTHVTYTKDNVKFIDGSKGIRMMKRKLSRNDLGIEYLNEWFEGCECHHINNNQIVCIPKELHRKYPHNHRKTETMLIINKISFSFLTSIIKQL